ncbi:hypothetical protein BDN70DRAFT_992517 [Pholiota conissans]|uniref:LysM domain-containing protein n=1 Tax=Pholiota conissans TaxID=109636 RepID=A0A9P6CUM5_9AGAR|nr:hypothetical protein BDN70DRAFT_992517 [Pholiota conissans]
MQLGSGAVLLLYFLKDAFVLASGSKESFVQKLHGVSVAHQRLHQSQMLDHLAASTAVTGAPSLPSTILAAASGFQLYASDSLPTSPAPPSACANALTGTLSCDPSVQLMAANVFFNSSMLSTLCTSACTSSLKTYRSGVVSACGSYQLPGPNNISYAPTLAIDTLSGPYQQQCLTDTSSGSFCNDVLPTYNASVSGVLGYPHNELCTSCVLGTLQLTLENPLSYSQSTFNTLQNALGACGSSFDSFNVTTTASAPFATTGPGTIVSSSNLTYSPACYISGRNITTSGTGNTCASLATEFSITTADVLLNNPNLSSLNCTAGFGAGIPLCLPKACTLYTVQANQTCQDVVDDANHRNLNGQNVNITFTQLLSFNPELGNGCSNIGGKIGADICISPHGGFPSLGDAPTDVSKPTSTITATAPPPGQTVPGTTAACGAWYLVQPNNFCTQVVLNNSITLDDFLTLNPEVNQNCTNLWADYYYCVAPFPPLTATSVAPPLTANATSFRFFSSALPTPVTTSEAFDPYPSVTPAPVPTNLAPGSLQFGCNFYFDVTSIDNCTSVEDLFGLTEAQFKAYNPEATKDCPTLTSGEAVCVLVFNATATFAPVPTNVAPGTITTSCEAYYTVVSDDTCPIVEMKNNVTDAQFKQWNPEINPTCSNLVLGEAYCVSMASQSNSSSTTTAIPPPPTNVAAGTNTTGCIAYYTIVSDDTCPVVETKNNITDAQFRLWNPEINAGCTNILLGEAYCVAMATPTITTMPSRSPTSTPSGSPTSSPGSVPTNIATGTWTNCTTYHTIISGDSCATVESSANIAIADFLKWNPEVTINCNIDLDEAYCTLGPNPCKTIHTVASGDFCFAIASNAGLTTAQLMALNPFLDANCDLQLGWNLCIAGLEIFPG